jgi:hypothetical protein
MIFGRKKDTVAAPPANRAEPIGDAVVTPLRLETMEPSVRELVRAIAALNDDSKWLAERFEKLQNRVTTELREIRREVDRFYEEPEETE